MSGRKSTTIWHFCSNRWHSAITEYAFSTLRALNLRGYENKIFLKEKSAASQAAEREKISYEALPSFTIPVIKRFYGSSQRPDFIFTYGGEETFSARFLLGSAKRIRFRGEYSRGILAGSKIAGQVFSHAIVYPSHSLSVEVGGSNQIEASIPLGRNTSIFNQSTDESESRKNLLIVGRLDPIKGHLEFGKIFASALKRISEKTPESAPHLRILGEPKNTSAAEIHTAYAALGLQDGKHYSLVTERVPNVASEMRMACLGVIPSKGSELIVRVAEEFLLCGTPLYTSGVGALQEVTQAFGGWSFKDLPFDRSVDLLCEAFVKSRNEHVTERQSRARKAYAEFSLDVMGSRLDSILKKLGART